MRKIAKAWLGPLLSLGLLFLLGSIGYRVTEGWEWSDCLWMVLITITTIGFGEVEPLSDPGRIVTLLIIVGGIVVVQLTLQRLVSLSDSGYFQKMRELRFQRLLRAMNNHVIICGYGRIGKEIADQLQSKNIKLLILEKDPLVKKKAEEKGLQVLLADATLDQSLFLAGIHKCRSIVVTLPTDADNLYVVLSARALNQKCKTIARAETEEASKKLTLAGANIVVSPYVAAGKTMANASV